MMRALVGSAYIPFLGLLIGCGTPWEAQVGGLVYATMHTFIVGEFAGQPPSNQIHRSTRRICAAEDFLQLSSETVTRERFLKFDRECNAVAMKYSRGTVVGTVYLPSGYCETIQREYLKMLNDQVYSSVPESKGIVINYKGATLEMSHIILARSLDFVTSCNSDGSFSVVARRKAN